MSNKMNYREYGPIILRISLSLVFLWFGLTGVFNTDYLIGYVPDFASNLPISLESIVILNGIFEIVLGTLLIIGLFTRIVAFILFLHTLIIMFLLGYNDVAVRDFGLAFATLAIAFNGPDNWSLDRKYRNK